MFPKCFSRVNDYGVRAKTLFNTYYQNFNIQRNIINWQNNNPQIKEEDNESTPINMTTLDDGNKEIVTENIEMKKENENDTNNNNNENLNEKKKKKTQKVKLIILKQKKEKRELKKQKLLKQLNENTEKLQKLKKVKK